MRSLIQRPRALIMGIINTTPDSFSDGGRFIAMDAALRHALSLIEEGADVLDIGGESTRPGAQSVTLSQELDRVIPLIEHLRNETDIPISIDTSKPEVMRAAVRAGANMINDVNGLRAEQALDVASQAAVPVCIMHMQGTPGTMQAEPMYGDVVADVIGFFLQRIQACIEAGIETHDIIVDPGIGFGKTLSHNLALLQAVPRIRQQTGREVLVGVSRKFLIGELRGRPVNERLPASLGLVVQSVLNGAKIIRVHDVGATVDAVRCVEAVANYQSEDPKIT